MTIKAAFGRFLEELGIAPSQKFLDVAAPDFGAQFYHFARRVGYDIATSPRLVLDRINIPVEEVLDIGVHDGTPWLYAKYPEAHFVLVEPQRNAEARLKDRPKNYRFVNKAVGEAPGMLVLTEGEERSSLLDRVDSSGLGQQDTQRYEVPVVTLDSIIDDCCQSDAIALKIDVEGFEYRALKGLRVHAHRIAFVILEASIRNRFAGEGHFGQITGLLTDKGFRFYNIMNSARPSPPNAYDMIFLPSHSSHFDIRALRRLSLGQLPVLVASPSTKRGYNLQ